MNWMFLSIRRPGGLPGLTEAVADYHQRQSGRETDPNQQVLITCGAMHALQCTMLALLDPGDEGRIAKAINEVKNGKSNG